VEHFFVGVQIVPRGTICVAGKRPAGYTYTMYLDIVICLFLALCAFLGWRKGFMRSIVGFVASIISLVAAIFAAKPLANLFDKWFNLSAHLGGQGRFINFLICIVLIYTIIYLIFFFVHRAIKKAKQDNKTLDKADKIAGIFLGLVKGTLSICMTLLTLYFLSVIPFMEKVVEWLLNKSAIGRFFYDLTVKIITPILGAVEAAIKG